MITRSANAEWKGTLKEGAGKIKLGSGAWEGQYGFKSRFEDGPGSNPEELIGAAHAGCFTMALSAQLSNAGLKPERLATTARVMMEKKEAGFTIVAIELETEGQVPGIDESKFLELAQTAKATCPISRALAAVGDIRLKAKLKK